MFQLASYAASDDKAAADKPSDDKPAEAAAKSAEDTPHAAPAAAAAEHAAASHGEHGDHAPHKVYPPVYYSGDWYTLGQFGKLRVTIGYYIDSLTVLMFAMVTFIATCIHFYANGYMHDELHEVVDHEVTVHGHHLHRPGRFHRFFQYLSLFCFSMLGIVIAGNIAMVFVFWELVGICSYFLIGFYIERQECLDRREQGLHRQSHRRLRHDHRLDGLVRQPGHVFLRRLA